MVGLSIFVIIFLFKLEDSMELWQLFPVIAMFRFIEMSSSVALFLSLDSNIVKL